jgi:diguanylate cyclase (GGDEF)-like protein
MASPADKNFQGPDDTRATRIFPMKRLIPAFAIILGCASAAWAAAPATLRAIRLLTNAEARRELPVVFEGTVTYYRKGLNSIFMQEDGLGLFVLAATETQLVPGDHVLVRGTTRDSFRPIVISNDVTLLRHGALPKPVPATFDELVRAQLDCMLVTVHGVVRAADLVRSPVDPVSGTTLQLLTDGGYIDVSVSSEDASALTDLLDAEVEVTGVAGGTFDDKMQLTGVRLFVSSMANVKIIKRAGSNPWSMPATAMDQILSGYRVNNLTQRVRVHGTVTYYQPGAAVVLQEGAKSLRIMTETYIPLQIGDLVDATGIPDLHDGFLTLAHGEFQDSHIQAPIKPLAVTWRQLALTDNTPAGHLFDLVSTEGQVVTEVREAAQDKYVLTADGHLFSAIHHHPDAASAIPLPKMKMIPLGSKVRVIGICTPHSSDPLSGPVEFDILLRSFDDIAVVAGPSLLSIGNLILVVGLLLVLVVAASARGWTLERKVHQKTAELAVSVEAKAALQRWSAQLEQMRSHILEDINGSRPLAEVIEEIAELVSFTLNGAPCWCQIADGARLGNCPPELTALCIVREEIPARSGPPLGTLFAALDPLAKPGTVESEALSMGAGLATLAIETLRLYPDQLLHHSEFDLLTDIHNRFSLEKHINAQIEEARQNAAIFGLIYIGLDEFKQANDLYGHRIGDLYLQEAAQRMKQQLRSHELLARLGGDEFAVLLPKVRNRASVEEIAQRLERCLDEPFALEGLTLQGSASFGIALYPEDSATRDGILSAADAAMYKTKNAKKQSGQAPAGNQNPKLIPKNQT